MDRRPETVSAYRRLFADVYDDALRFALRRADAADAEEAVSSALMIAWRRFDRAPDSFDARRAWVFGIVRKTLLNQRRGAVRRKALAVRIADHASSDAADDLLAVEARADLSRAWKLLSARQQEVIALAAFEQCDAATAARTLGISPAAYRVRLSRARRALRAVLHDRERVPALAPHPTPLETP